MESAAPRLEQRYSTYL